MQVRFGLGDLLDGGALIEPVARREPRIGEVPLSRSGKIAGRRDQEDRGSLEPDQSTRPEPHRGTRPPPNMRPPGGSTEIEKVAPKGPMTSARLRWFREGEAAQSRSRRRGERPVDGRRVAREARDRARGRARDPRRDPAHAGRARGRGRRDRGPSRSLGRLPMKCKVCREHAVVDIRRHNAAFCSDHFVEHVHNQVAKTIKEFRMFGPDDRLLVAVSGGKDSLAVWEVLLDLGYDATGFYLDLGIGGYSTRSKDAAIAFAEAC